MGDGYLASDLFLVKALEDIMRDHRDELEEMATREAWPRARLQEEILKDGELGEQGRTCVSAICTSTPSRRT